MYEKRQVQQEKLVKAACDLAAERGIKGLRTRDIAAKAGVSIGTLHYCFETKEHLLRALYRYLRAEFRASLDGILYNQGVPTDTLPATTRARLHLLKSSPVAYRAWRAFTQEAWTDATARAIVKEHFAEQRSRLEAVVVRGREDGDSPGPSVKDPRLAAAVLVSIFEGLVVQWTIDPEAFTLDEYARAVAEICQDQTGGYTDLGSFDEQVDGGRGKSFETPGE